MTLRDKWAQQSKREFRLRVIEVEKRTHRFVCEVACGRLRCLVLERVAKNRDSGNFRQFVWLDCDDMRIIRIPAFRPPGHASQHNRGGGLREVHPAGSGGRATFG